MDIVDLDAIIAEEKKKAKFTPFKLRGKTWRFQPFRDVPLSLFTEEIGDRQEELQRIALTLSTAVDPKQRKAFSELQLTVREAEALWNAVITAQQGVSPGESEASPES